MRKKILLFVLWACLFPALLISAQENVPEDSRSVMRSTLIGAGFSNVFDTYLSPIEYEGFDVRLLHESIRDTRLMDGRVSFQSLTQANFSYTENPSKTGSMYTGLVSWNCAFHYRFRINDRLQVLFGPMLDLNGGFIYNVRNSNNPAQGKAYGSVGASGMVVYKFRIARYPMTVRYQANLPLIGAMFSPEYGESYYEIFSLGNEGKHVSFTSLHNNPSLRQMLTLDFPIRKVVMRVGYVCDLQQAKVNRLKTHIYSHDFMIGFVKHFYLLK